MRYVYLFLLFFISCTNKNDCLRLTYLFDLGSSTTKHLITEKNTCTKSSKTLFDYIDGEDLGNYLTYRYGHQNKISLNKSDLLEVEKSVSKINKYRDKYGVYKVHVMSWQRKFIEEFLTKRQLKNFSKKKRLISKY